MTTEQLLCLIPVRLHACVIDPNTLSRTKEVVKEDGTIQPSTHAWAWHSPNYEKLDAKRTEALERIWPNLFEAVVPPGMQGRGGICLSITLPEGFSKPFPGQTQNLPRLPDRWLWVRILRPIYAVDGTPVDEPVFIKTWIVDAGVATDNAESPFVIHDNEGRMAATRIGVERTLQEALQYGPDEPRLPIHYQGTNLGASLTFANYAPQNLNNTSYIDRLDDISPDDLARSVLSYFVIGWYRDPDRDDPLSILRLAGHNLADIYQILHFDKQSPNDSPLGERAIFHGLAAHIDYWNPRSHLGPAFGSPLSDPTHPCVGTFHYPPQKIGFGATPEDAFAALAADLSPEDAASQKLSADFFQILRMLLLDRLDAGETTATNDVLRIADQNATFQRAGGNLEWTIGPMTSGPTPAPSPPQIDISIEQRTQLRALNQLQARSDEAQGKFMSAAESLYTIWWQTLRARGRRKAALEESAKRRTEIALTFQTEVQQLQITIDSARLALQTSIDTSLGAGVAEVRSTAVDHYHVPKEPAVAIRNIGPKVPPFSRLTIPRTLEQIAQSFATNSYPRLTRAPVHDHVRNHADPKLTSILEALAAEASLVEEAVAAIVRSSSPPGGFDSLSNVEQWQERNRLVRIRESEFSFVAKNGERLPLNRLGMTWTEQPWIPLFLDWEVEWFSEADSQNSSEGTPLQGRTILASRPQTMIQSQMGRMAAMATKMAPLLADCRPLLEDVMQWDILAQTLSGLHQQLLLRDDLLPRVLPVDEPLRSLVARTSLAPPNLAPNLEFSSLRRGHLRVSRLWVVDAFGQAFSLDPAIKTSIAASSARSFPLDSRLLEPARLKVEFAPDPTTNQLVRAWILPIFAEKSLVVYDPGGQPLGLICRGSTSDNTPGTTWQSITANGQRNPSDLSDPILASFIAPLVGGPEARVRFDSLLQHIDEALARTLPAQSTALHSPASLLGRPLVLVRTDVCLERRGGLIESPLDLAANTPSSNSTIAMSSPVWLGLRNRLDDGVIGFMIADSTGPLQRTAKLQSGSARSAPAFQLDLSANPNRVPLTLLMDPWGAIYFESEILPLETLRLPPEWVNGMVTKLPAVMRLAPALIHSHALLRAISSSANSSIPNIELPLPMSHNNKSSLNARANLVVNAGTVVPVKPISSEAILSETFVAAIEGFLIS